jgi:hypothetical protein
MLQTYTGYICNGHPPTEKRPFGCSGYVTAVAAVAGQNKRLAAAATPVPPPGGTCAYEGGPYI